MKRLIAISLFALFLPLLAFAQTPAQGQGAVYSAPVPPFPTSFTCGVVGTPGSTTYYYWVVAIHPAGHVANPIPYLITNAPGTLNGSNYVTCNWNNPAPAQISMTFALLRSTTAVFPGTGTTAVTASTSSLTANDQSNTLNAYTFSAAASASSLLFLDNQTNSNPTWTVRDTNSNNSLQIIQSANGVNGLKLTTGATGTGVAISSAVTGADANAPLNLTAAGTSSVNLKTGDGARTGFSVANVASSVNGLLVTPAATGNPTVLSPGIAGSDAAAGITVNPNTTGTVTIAGLTNAPTVNIANTSTAGAAVSIAGAATATGNTDTVNIATGNTAGTGAKVVHIADGTPAGTNTVTIGSNANTANVTTIQGGNGTGAIALTPQTTGTIVVGAAAGSGNITVGSSSTTQTVLIGNGAGAATVSLANAGTSGNTVNVAGAATAGGNTDTLNIATGNAAATAIKAVNILTGTPGTSGNNRLQMGGGATSKVTVNAVASAYTDWNYVAELAGGANNAITANVTDASGANIPLAAGLRVCVQLATHTLQAGANTLAINGGAVKNIKSHFNVANNNATAYAVTGLFCGIYDGTEWVDLSQ